MKLLTGLFTLLLALVTGWLIKRKKDKELMINWEKVPDKVKRWKSSVQKYADLFQVPESLIYAIIWQESSGRMNVQHDSSALGLMGVKPIAAEDVRINDPGGVDFDITGWKRNTDKHIGTGVAYLRLLYEREGNWNEAIESYKEGGTGQREEPEKARVYLEKVRDKQKFFT